MNGNCRARGVDHNALADERIHARAVDGQRHTRVHRNRAAAGGSRRRDGVRVAGCGHRNGAGYSGKVRAAADGGNDVRLEIRHRAGYADGDRAAGNGKRAGEHLAVIDTRMDGNVLCVLYVARHNRVHFRKHEQNGNGNANANKPAARRNADQTDGGCCRIGNLIFRFVVDRLRVAVDVFNRLGLRTRAGGYVDRAVRCAQNRTAFHERVDVGEQHRYRKTHADARVSPAAQRTRDHVRVQPVARSNIDSAAVCRKLRRSVHHRGSRIPEAADAERTDGRVVNRVVVGLVVHFILRTVVSLTIVAAARIEVGSVLPVARKQGVHAVRRLAVCRGRVGVCEHIVGLILRIHANVYHDRRLRAGIAGEYEVIAVKPVKRAARTAAELVEAFAIRIQIDVVSLPVFFVLFLLLVVVNCIVRVLTHHVARNYDGERNANARRAADADGSDDCEHVAVGACQHLDAAARRHNAARADGGFDRVEADACENGNANARDPCSADCDDNCNQPVCVTGFDIDAAVRVQRHGSFGVCFCNDLGNDNIERAAYARRAADGRAGRVRGYDFLRVGINVDIARRSGYVRAGMDVSKRLIVEIGEYGNCGNARRAAAANRQSGVDQQRIRARRNRYALVCGNRSAECRRDHIMKYQRVCAARNAGCSGRAKRDGEQEQIVLGVCGNANASTRGNRAKRADVRRYVFEEYQHDDSRAYAHRTARGERPREVYNQRFVVCVNFNVPAAKFLAFAVLGNGIHVRSARRDVGRRLNERVNDVFHHQRVDNAGHRNGTGERSGNGDEHHILVRRRADEHAAPLGRAVRKRQPRARAAGKDDRALADNRLDGVGVNDRGKRGTNRVVAGSGESAADNVGMVVEIRQYAYGTVSVEFRALTDFTPNRIEPDQNWNRAVERVGSRARGSKRQLQRPVLAVCLHQHVARRRNQLCACADQRFDVALEHAYADGRAHGVLACRAERHAEHEHPCFTKGEQAHIVPAGKNRAVVNFCARLVQRNQNAQRSGNRGAAAGNRSRRQHVDELVLGQRANSNASIRAGQACCRFDFRKRNSVGHDHGERSANGGCRPAARKREGGEQEIRFRAGKHVDIRPRRDARARADER